MHPDDELKKRLRERFTSYEPEPETSWRQFEGRLLIPPKPFRKKGRVVVAVMLVLLMTAGLGLWISQRIHKGNVETSSKAKETVSESSLSAPGAQQRAVEKQLSISHLSQREAVSALQRVSEDLAEFKPLKETHIHPIKTIIKANDLDKSKGRILSGINTRKPILDHRPSSRKSGMGFISVLVKNDEKNTSLSEHDALKNRSLLYTDSSLFSADLPEGVIGTLNARLITPLSVRLLSPHISIQPISEDHAAIEPSRAQGVWVLKGGPLLNYSVMNSKFREDNSALNLENLRSSLPERLGWQLYLGRQHPLSHGRQLETGAVVRRFGQAIRYQVSNGAYSVSVQPDRSVIVIQLRDTLSDRSTTVQAGLRLGYRAPISLSSGLHWGVGGEVVYQLNLHHTVVNAEVTLGKTLLATRSTTFLVELFANTAVRPVYDSNNWVRVLPYHVGLRVGMPLRFGE